MAALDFFEDIGSLGRPNKRFGVLIVNGKVILDRGIEFADAAKHAATNPLVAEVAKEALHHIEPGGGSRSEVGGGFVCGAAASVSPRHACARRSCGWHGTVRLDS